MTLILTTEQKQFALTSAGARGPRGQTGAASGPLGDSTVGANEITDDDAGQTAIVSKLGLASTAPNKGAALVGFKQPLSGAVVRTAYDKFLETVSVKDFGAIGDGVADDTAAVQLALLSGVASVYVPEGRYRITANITRDGNTLLHGDGLSVSVLVMEGTSSLLFDGGAAGDEFGTSALQIERLGFEVTGSTSKTVISAIWAAGIGGTSKTVTVRDVQIVAGNAASTFGKALYLKNARNVLIDNMRILGDRDGSPIDADFGIDIFGDDDAAPVEIYMRGVLAYYCVQPFNIAGWVEGVNFDQCAAINCRRGIKAVATTTSPRPWVRVSGCHINTDTAAIELTNFVQFIVNGNLIYATDFDAVSAAYSAITVDGQNASMDSLITDNILQCLLTGVAKNGIVIEPGDIASDDNVTISRNVIVSFDTGIVLQANTTGVRVADDNDIRFCTDDIIDLGDNLVCAARLTADSGNKASLDGAVEKWGSNVIMLNASGDGVVPFNTAFGTFLGAVACNGDPAIAPTAQFIVNTTASTQTDLAISVRPNPGAISVRVNWRAVGAS